MLPLHRYPRHLHSTYSASLYTRHPAHRGGHGISIRNLCSLLHVSYVFSSLEICLRGSAVRTVSASFPLPSLFPLCTGRHLYCRGQVLIYSTIFHQRKSGCRESIAKHCSRSLTEAGVLCQSFLAPCNLFTGGGPEFGVATVCTFSPYCI